MVFVSLVIRIQGCVLPWVHAQVTHLCNQRKQFIDTSTEKLKSRASAELSESFSILMKESELYESCCAEDSALDHITKEEVPAMQSLDRADFFAGASQLSDPNNSG